MSFGKSNAKVYVKSSTGIKFTDVAGAQLLPIRRRMECGEVLELCSPILPKLSPAPEDGWLSFCYRYIRGALYPAGDFAPDGEEYAGGARFYLTVLQVLLDQERRALPFDPF